jgi:nucleoside-diphosphate-sugar epimerase
LSGLVLVTGGAGVLGRRLLTRLRSEGWRTRALVHRSGVAGADEIVEGDVNEPLTLTAAVAGVSAILHLAAVTHARRPADYERINALGTDNLVRAARTSGMSRFVHVSTRAIDEGGGAYSRSKAHAERLVGLGGIPGTIVRLPDVYGGDGHEGIDTIISAARAGRHIPIVGRGGEVICPVHIDDTVSALTAALRAPAAAGKTYTLGGDCLTVLEFAELCIRTFGSSSRVLRIPVPIVATLAIASRILPLPLYPDQLKRLRTPKPPISPDATSDLDFRPRPLSAGLQELTSPTGA